MTTVFVYEHLCAMGARDGDGLSLAPSLLVEGRAMRDAIVEDLRSVPASALTLDNENEAEFRGLAGHADFSVVIAPETNGILEERCRWVEEEGGQLLGPASDSIRLAGDKLKLAIHLAKAGIPTPRTWRLGEQPADLFPLVVKPRDGAGSQATFLVCDRSEICRPSDKRSPTSEMIAQEFVAGIPASVAFLIGPRDCIGLVPCAQHLSDDGSFGYLGGHAPLADELADRATLLALRAVRSVTGLLGYVGVDLVLADDPRYDCVIEINPRLTTSYVGLRELAQFNIAEMLLRVVCGESLPPLEWRPGSIEFVADGSTLANPPC
jgi:predicted ATP-grasp superfamily ATP-dependent carboligase